MDQSRQLGQQMEGKDGSEREQAIQICLAALVRKRLEQDAIHAIGIGGLAGAQLAMGTSPALFTVIRTVFVLETFQVTLVVFDIGVGLAGRVTAVAVEVEQPLGHGFVFFRPCQPGTGCMITHTLHQLLTGRIAYDHTGRKFCRWQGDRFQYFQYPRMFLHVHRLFPL